MQDRLYSKFAVYKKTDTGTDPEKRGSFVLVPYNIDGTVRDKAAIAALVTYAAVVTEELPGLAQDIMDWVEDASVGRGINDPTV